MQGAYDAGMQNDEDEASQVRPYRLARRKNLSLLIAEAGGASQLARLCDTPKSHISAMSHGARNVGDDLASKLESVMEKPAGWLDVPHDGEPTIAASRPVTIGQVAMALGASVAGLSESRRRTISALVAAQISDQPDQQEADAIDALAPGLAIDVAPSWREILHGYIEALDPGPDRDLLEAVFAAVDAKHSELAHRKDAKSVGKITHPLGG